MLKRQSDKLRYCYQRAMDCRIKARLSREPPYRADMLQMEEHWLVLARSYELTESLSDFSAEVRHHLGRK